MIYLQLFSVFLAGIQIVKGATTQDAGGIPDQPTTPEMQMMPQTVVVSEGKKHAVFITITLESPMSKECVKPAREIQMWVDEIASERLFVFPETEKNAEVIAGVGFAPDICKQFCQSAGHFKFHSRTGVLGTMPHSGGHIFVHAKSHNRGNLRYLTEKTKMAFPSGCIKGLTDIYSFTYRINRDLSGFIDGTENVGDLRRTEVAVNAETGGSFCLTQRWFHNFDVIHAEEVKTLEGWVGRFLGNSTEKDNKSAESHVARMTSGPAKEAAKPFQIYRQSMPFGSVKGPSGLYFIAYANLTKNFDYMLDRMVGHTNDYLSDNIMKLSRAISGKYWYFPSQKELKTFTDTM